MRYVDQRNPPDFRSKGDCFSACLASLLEIPLEDVPVFVNRDPMGGAFWTDDVNRFLEPYGVSLVGVKEDGIVGSPPLCLHIGHGPSATDEPSDEGHAVLMHGDALVHDGRPTRDGIREVWYRWFLVPRVEGRPTFPRELRRVRTRRFDHLDEPVLLLAIGGCLGAWLAFLTVLLAKLL